MAALSKNRFSLLLYFFIINNLIIIYAFLILDCPEEINDYCFSFITIQTGYFRRFSQCFYCICYDLVSYLCILNNKIFIFSSSLNNQFDLSTNLTGNYYSLLIISQYPNQIDYLIYFVDYKKHINFLHYSFIFNEQNNQFIKKKTIDNLEIEDPKSLSCHINSANKHLSCFYIIKPYIYSEIFDINNNFTIINKTNITFEFKDNNKITLKTSITQDNMKILLCWEQKSNKAYCIIYINNNFEDSKPLNYCETTNQIMEIYFYNNYFLFFCRHQNNKNFFQLFKLNKDHSEFENVEQIQISNNDIFYGHFSWFNYKNNEECNLTIYDN